jgi:alkanesulfonate monooxygenase SsuD/methylene tetrahydromethanopterin reductase-like flavin-dependent oxidoreductase (luciferase family)
VSVPTARWCADWADGLITVAAPLDRLRQIVAAYREGGGRGPLRLQVHLSYAADEREALRIAYEQWRSNVFAPPVCWDLELVDHFDEAARHVGPEAVREVVRVSPDPGRHAAWLQEYADLGFDEIYLHHVGKRQEEFLDVFGAKVLPQLTGGRP